MKKSVFLCWLAILLLGGCRTANAPTPSPRAAAAPESAPAGVESAVLNLPYTAQPVTIDGVLQEACWRETPAVGDYIYGKVGEKESEPCLRVWYAWDENYLYIAYETFDRNLVARASGEKQGPPGRSREGCSIWVEGVKVDVVEFFISAESDMFFWEIHHNALNQFNDVWCIALPEEHPLRHSSMFPHGIYFGNAEFLADDPPYTVEAAVKLKPKADGGLSTVNEEKDVDSGYTAEIRIPWRAVGVPETRATWVEKEDPGQGGKKVRIPGPWRMEGQTLWLLGVVQD
ncbi:MAG: hypothetical protein N3A66_08785, partial [Planctomycetota bacterium]|nr:hypothetical protein [Planctomycetota bacterium]